MTLYNSCMWNCKIDGLHDPYQSVPDHISTMGLACKIADQLVCQLLKYHLSCYRLHLHNSSLQATDSDSYIDKFGFDCATCCGFIAMPNTWKDNWPVKSLWGHV